MSSPLVRTRPHFALTSQPPCPPLGTVEPFSLDPSVTNQLEKRYFTPGNLGFRAFRAPALKASVGGDESPIVGMLICNDRRWAEGWRVLGMQGVEIVCIGYVSSNTLSRNPRPSVATLLKTSPIR